MSETGYSCLGATELIDEFVRVALECGANLPPEPTIGQVSPTRAVLLGKLRAIGAELKARVTIEQLRQLYDHESDAVRTFAAGSFFDIDEEWALATIAAVQEGISREEVLSLCARAKRGPPAVPTLADMSTEQLTARYEDAGIRNYATRFMGGDSEPWDLELDNRIIEELIAVVAELRARGAVAALLPLLDHANVAVRGFAAGACLAVAPERAVPVLEAIIAEEGSLDEGRASWALRRWRDDGLPRR